ncbi:hypothetical protein VNO77_24900 [Canavalia gladiata]|uniref:ATP-dependent Clp protease proteolytic subunit n=1 Tax=Canavalia gladiata TaxID=3824 RepID=A0AAN9L744_CANGL
MASVILIMILEHKSVFPIRCLLSHHHLNMAVAPYTTGSAPRVSVPSTPSFAAKLHSGLKPQFGGSFGVKPSASAEFYAKVHKTLQFRYVNLNPSRAQIQMMPIGTPRVPYKSPGEGAWQWVDLWNALYRERIICIGQEIDEDFSNQILATMLYLDSIENKNLFLFFNCPGGDVSPCMAIYDTMKSLQNSVATRCLGYANNLAAFLLAAGEKGNRSAMPMSRISLASPAGAARGQADDIINEANELLRIRNYMLNELSKITGQRAEKIAKDLRTVKYFEAREAIEYGLIDRISRPSRIKADAPVKDEDTTGLG